LRLRYKTGSLLVFGPWPREALGAPRVRETATRKAALG
jgi:hypothetical protein